MTRLTFGVNASSFIANISVKQNARDHALEYPLASKVVDNSFYVDDGLTGQCGYNYSCRTSLPKGISFYASGTRAILVCSKNSQSSHDIPDPDEYTKALGIEWQDCFRFTVSELPHLSNMTKRSLVSDIAKLFDVLGWFSPAVVKMKILLQQLWELG